jgi:hypothetical protein
MNLTEVDIATLECVDCFNNRDFLVMLKNRN